MIESFRASFTEGLAKPSRFEAFFTPRSETLQLASIIDAETLAFRCESAILPGRTIATGDLRIYGPTEKFPYQTSYEDITLTFICTDSMNEKKFFDTWLNIINPKQTWNFKYKSDYTMDLTVIQYTNDDKEAMRIKMIDAFPLSVNQLDLDWANADAYHKLSVTFAYTYWESAEEAAAAAENSGTDGQVPSNIPSMLTSSPDTMRQGTQLDITNQSIGPFDAVKDNHASAVNQRNVTRGMTGAVK